MTLRADLALIVDWIEPGSRVLDLGCGDGSLMAHLAETRGVTGYGVEIDIDNVVECVRRGVNVIQDDLNDGLSAFDRNTFDYVVMSQTLQTMARPDLLLEEMLRVGRQGIVTLPNFGHWRCRWQIGIVGRMPVSPALPAQWYDTDNIHLCSLSDFETLCAARNIRILRREVVNHAHQRNRVARLLPNLLGEVAIYRVERHV